ncbi:MAG: alkaline phosphatase family protein [Nitrospirota bacterium]
MQADDTPLFFPTIPATTSTFMTDPISTVASTPMDQPRVPAFTHIVIVMLENKDFGEVIGDPKMPIFNKLAKNYTLLTQYYAIAHPSLPNYIALIGGDTFGITTDCTDCNINAPSLPDLIEASGRTWKTYQQDMPSPCYSGNSFKNYVKRHNPFVYFDPIRLDRTRCEKNIVPLTMLQTDADAGQLPNFIFISPDLCNDAHDCSIDYADEEITDELNILVPALNKTAEPYLIVINWDEGNANTTTSCCGLPEQAGGRIAIVLISPQVKNGFEDDTPYTHYSLLKTIAESWGLPYLGHAADDNNVLIIAPWK